MSKNRKGGCPTPGKVQYKTREAAEHALRRGRFNGLTSPVRYYRCRGGHFHVTSLPQYARS